MRLTDIWRYPIKAHGAERVLEVTLSQGKTMPWDRHWAVAHAAAQISDSQWSPCRNFSRGAGAPKLMGIMATLDEQARRLTLAHPDLPDLVFWPEDTPQAFLDWVKPIMPEDRPASVRLVTSPDRGMTDSDYPTISLLNRASLDDLSARTGQPLDPRRFRGNLWCDGLDPWKEFELVGKRIAIGSVTAKVTEPITRCRATTANPETGERDVDTLGTLNRAFGHQDFGVFLEIETGGTVKTGDTIKVIA